MPNQLIDRGVKYTPAENVNPDFKKGFLETVKNSQPRMALNYLIDILNEINERILVLEELAATTDKDDSGDKTEVDKPAVKRTTKAASAKAEGDVEEV